MPTHSNMNQSKQMANQPVDQRPSGADPDRGASSGSRDVDEAKDNAPGARDVDKTGEQQQQGPGQSSPGLKDREAKTSGSYGDTRDSGDPSSR